MYRKTRSKLKVITRGIVILLWKLFLSQTLHFPWSVLTPNFKGICTHGIRWAMIKSDDQQRGC